MPLSPEHRHFIFVQQGVTPAIFNIILNGAIAWLLMRGNPYLTLWGEGAVGPDLLITGFLLAFLSCVIVSRLITNQIRDGKVAKLESHAIASTGWHHRSTLARALLLGVVGLFLCAGPTVAALDAVGVEPMSVGWFVGFKALWAGVLAALVTPVIAWWALSAASATAALEAAATDTATSG